MENIREQCKKLGSKPSISEEHGLKLLDGSDLIIFSPGISTGGFAEIRMAQENSDRKIIATTIDEKGLNIAKTNVNKLGLTEQIEMKLEDLRTEFPYEKDFFDFIYARLVLHYLSAQDLDKVLSNFREGLKISGRLFIVIRSSKNIPEDDPNVKFDRITNFTSIPYYDKNGSIEATGKRYFHSPETITDHLEKAGFKIQKLEEYQERLYKDFMREEPSPRKDHLIEVIAT